MKTIDKNVLENMVNSGLTVPEIAIELRVSHSTIDRRMSKYGLISKSDEKKYIIIKCKECGKDFKSLKIYDRKFCSRKCSILNNNKIIKEKRIEINEKISKKLTKIDKNGFCLYCGNTFKKRNLKNVYCSRKCQSKHLSNRPEEKERVGKFFSKLTKERHDKGDDRIGWKTRNKLTPSYPEKVTIDYFNQNNIKFEREFKIGKYFIDFAFPDKKIGLEIDGRTHEDVVVIEKDKRKKEFIESLGWKLYRIKWINDNKHFDRLNAFIVQVVENNNLVGYKYQFESD